METVVDRGRVDVGDELSSVIKMIETELSTNNPLTTPAFQFPPTDNFDNLITEDPIDIIESTDINKMLLETLNINFTAFEGGVLPAEDCAVLKELNYTYENLTCLRHAPIYTHESQVRTIVLAVMAVLSLVGNTATIISIAREKRRSRSTVYTLIHHLSVADLFVTFACLTTEAVWTFTVQWLAGNFLCKAIKYLQMFSLYLSTFILVLIGVDRFTAVRYPMRHSDTQRQCSYGIVFVWILSGILSIPQVLVFHVMKGPFIEDFYQCVTYGIYTHAWVEQAYGIFSLLCMFVLPLFILLITYVSTFITLHKSEKVFRSERTTLGNTCPEFNRRRLLRKAKMRALRISVVIVLAFVICWTPYYLMMIIFMFTTVEDDVAAELQSGIFFFGMSNSLVNPIIYGAFHLCRCHKRKASFNLIVVNRDGSHLGYRTAGRASTRSTTCRSSAAEMETSVVNVFEDGVRYSFRRRSSRQRTTSFRGGIEGGVEPLKNSFRYGRSVKSNLSPSHQTQNKTFLGFEGLRPLAHDLKEEEEDLELQGRLLEGELRAEEWVKEHQYPRHQELRLRQLPMQELQLNSQLQTQLNTQLSRYDAKIKTQLNSELRFSDTQQNSQLRFSDTQPNSQLNRFSDTQLNSQLNRLSNTSQLNSQINQFSDTHHNSQQNSQLNRFSDTQQNSQQNRLSDTQQNSQLNRYSDTQLNSQLNRFSDTQQNSQQNRFSDTKQNSQQNRLSDTQQNSQQNRLSDTQQNRLSDTNSQINRINDKKTQQENNDRKTPESMNGKTLIESLNKNGTISDEDKDSTNLHPLCPCNNYSRLQVQLSKESDTQL